MKEFDDIRLEDLERMASDDSIEVPAGLDAEIKETVAALSFMEELEEKPAAGNSRKWLPAVGAAASIALLIGAGISINERMTRPADTFTDPYQAYAQLEQAFNMISSTMEKGASMALEANASIIDKTTELITNIN